MNIFIGNLDYGLDEIEIIKLFAIYGDVTTIKLIRDSETGNSKGFAFIEMPKESEANRAIEHVNGREINGKKLAVHEAKPQEEYNKEKELSKKQFQRPGSRPPFRGGNDRRDQRPPYQQRPPNKDYDPKAGFQKKYPPEDRNNKSS